MTICIILFVVFLLIGIPIAFALGLSAISVLLLSGYSGTVFLHRMINSISSFSMLAIPMYVLAGNLCSATGITKYLVNFCTTLVGHIPGGSAIVNILASLFFGGISGSAVADTAAIGGMMIPAMEEEGYESEFAGGVTIASSTIGILIPPSIPQCLYGICAGASIGAMFMAGVIPGLMVALLQILICVVICKRRNYPRREKAGIKDVWISFKKSVWALGMPLIIFVLCGMGVMTASEAGIVAVVYSLIIGLFVYKEFNLSQLPKIIVDSMVTSAVSLFIVGVASVVSWIINVEQIPNLLTDFLLNTLHSKILILLVINCILLIAGCFMDLVPAMLLFAPIFLPIVEQYGIEPTQFGIILTINLGIGLLTPPVGNCLFIASGITKSEPFQLFKAAIPFVLCNVVCLIAVHIFPVLTQFVPSLFGY